MYFLFLTYGKGSNQLNYGRLCNSREDGHRTIVSLEEPFWTGLKQIVKKENSNLSIVVRQIDMNRRQSNLSSAIRLFVLDNAKRLAE
jgi:predicted DNA-binding ribbon-helix-helix protein